MGLEARQPKIPAKGTETFGLASFGVSLFLTRQPKIPAKGTETSLRFILQ